MSLKSMHEMFGSDLLRVMKANNIQGLRQLRTMPEDEIRKLDGIKPAHMVRIKGILERRASLGRRRG